VHELPILDLPVIKLLLTDMGQCGADEIHELRKREKEQGLEPDWEIDNFMKASAARGKRHSIMTDYVMRMLGLEVCLSFRIPVDESDCSLSQDRGFHVTCHFISLGQC
jgi:hypothetical protein